MVFGFSKQKGKVYVGLSGGVDSAVSAALLKKQGYDVIGVFIRIAIEGYPCPAASDRIEAMRVAAHLKIPFKEIDLSKEYQKRVFDFSVAQFRGGRTPNPDALCNREIKFGLFYDFARREGADYVATGHYARIASQAKEKQVDGSIAQRDGASIGNFQQEIIRGSGDFVSTQLHAGLDENKDQSYFLWAVPEKHLRRALFPVGNLKKPQVRALAEKFGLPNSARPDSQGLCFLGDISVEDMLLREVAPQEGDVLSESGRVLGKHRGAALYTLGQRHGFELINRSSGTAPHFVVAKDMARNTITVSEQRYPSFANKTEIELEEINWIGEIPDGPCEARFRYRQKLIKATLEKRNGAAYVTLFEPHYVPQGQSLVLYRGAQCLGGGIIKKATLA